MIIVRSIFNKPLCKQRDLKKRKNVQPTSNAPVTSEMASSQADLILKPNM